jgi:hypothetical protein
VKQFFVAYRIFMKKSVTTMGMRKCYTAAIVLISWLLMLPPPIFPPVKDSSGHYKMNNTAPLSQWLTFKTLPSEEACKAQLKKVQPFYRCISSDDPALKKKDAAATGAPSVSTMTGAAGAHMQ